MTEIIVKYSGVFRISKRGGGKFLLATSAHTKGGKPSFPIFLVYVKKKFLVKGGPWHNAPLNTPLVNNVTNTPFLAGIN